MMSPFGLKVWQGQCTLISKPKLVPDWKQLFKKRAISWLNVLTGRPSQYYPLFKLKNHSGELLFLSSNSRWCLGLSDLGLTSVHQPFAHCFRHVKGDPLWGPFGEHVLGPNVALFPNVFVRPHNLQSNHKQSLWDIFSQHRKNKISVREKMVFFLCCCHSDYLVRFVFLQMKWSKCDKTTACKWLN